MTATSDEEGVETPWTIGDVAKSVAFIVVATALIFGGILFLRLFIPTSTVALLALAGAFMAELTMIVAVWLFGVRKYCLPWSAVGFRPFDPVRGLGLVGIVLLASVTVNVVYVQVITYLGLESLEPPPVLPPFLTGVWRLVVPLVLASGVAPVVEEAFFRGFVFVALRRRFDFWPAAVGSAILFTLSHLEISVLIPIFVLGLLLVWLYDRTGSIWPCIVLHFVYNTLALVISYLSEVSRSAA